MHVLQLRPVRLPALPRFCGGLDVYKRCYQDFPRANSGPPSFCQPYLPASGHFAVPSNARPPGPDLSGKDSNVVSVYSCCQYGAASGIVHLKVYTEASTAPAAVCHRGRQPRSLPARTGAGSQAGLLGASSISCTASRRQRWGRGISCERCIGPRRYLSTHSSGPCPSCCAAAHRRR